MPSPKRQTYLDWLRVFSVLGVLFSHAAIPFSKGQPWYVHNTETSVFLRQLNPFIHVFRMPLLFFISGTVSFYVIGRKSAYDFVRIRFVRLFIPLLVGIFIICPPMVFIQRMHEGIALNYFVFYRSIFTFRLYPEGNYGWHHLWFIAYLFLFDILLAPFFAWAVSANAGTLNKLLAKLTQGKAVYLLTLPSILWFTILSRRFPETTDLIHDGCYFIYWLSFLVAGFICILQPVLMDRLEQHRRWSLTIAVTSLLILYYLTLHQQAFGFMPGPAWQGFGNMLFIALRPVSAWSLVFGIVGYGKKYFTRRLPVLSYLNEAAYPWYILHQTVMVAIAAVVIRYTHMPVMVKYSLLVTGTFWITLLLYHVLLRPYSVTRRLFGLKVDTSQKLVSQKTEIVASPGAIPVTNRI